MSCGPQCPGFLGNWARVTEILSSKPKPYLEKWKAKWGVLAERKTAASNAIGTAFHKAIETQKYNGLSLRLNRMTDVFFAWASEHRLVIKESELHVWSEKHRYHGTLDAIGFVDGGPEYILLDYKTSRKIYPEMALQLAAYANAYEEMTGVKLKRGVIVLVSKDKPNHKLTVKEYKLDKLKFREFLQRKKDMEAQIGC